MNRGCLSPFFSRLLSSCSAARAVGSKDGMFAWSRLSLPPRASKSRDAVKSRFFIFATGPRLESPKGLTRCSGSPIAEPINCFYIGTFRGLLPKGGLALFITALARSTRRLEFDALTRGSARRAFVLASLYCLSITCALASSSMR